MTNALEEIRAALEPFIVTLESYEHGQTERCSDEAIFWRLPHPFKIDGHGYLAYRHFRRARRALALVDGLLAVDEGALEAAWRRYASMQARDAGDHREFTEEQWARVRQGNPPAYNRVRAAITAYLATLKDRAS